MCGTPVDRFRRTAKKLTRSLSPSRASPRRPRRRRLNQRSLVKINRRHQLSYCSSRGVSCGWLQIERSYFPAYSDDRVLSFISNRRVIRGESMQLLRTNVDSYAHMHAYVVARSSRFAFAHRQDPLKCFVHTKYISVHMYARRNLSVFSFDLSRSRRAFCGVH